MTRDELKKVIEARVASDIKKANKEWKREFPVPPIEFDGLRGKSAGVHRAEVNKDSGEVINHKLLFNLNIAELNDGFVDMTPTHEVAHYIAGVLYGKVQTHGEMWKNTMNRLGVENPAVYHSYILPAKGERVKGERKIFPIGVYPKMEVKSRGQAMDDKDVLYYTGEKCDKGHDAPRYVRDNMCKLCSQLLRVKKLLKTGTDD